MSLCLGRLVIHESTLPTLHDSKKNFDPNSLNFFPTTYDKQTIYSYPQNPRVFKALVVAKYNGLEVKVDDKFVMGTTNKTDAWIAKFGASQVPAFEGADGTIIIESGAIAYYRKSLCWLDVITKKKTKKKDKRTSM